MSNLIRSGIRPASLIALMAMQFTPFRSKTEEERWRRDSVLRLRAVEWRQCVDDNTAADHSLSLFLLADASKRAHTDAHRTGMDARAHEQKADKTQHCRRVDI